MSYRFYAVSRTDSDEIEALYEAQNPNTARGAHAKPLFKVKVPTDRELLACFERGLRPVKVGKQPATSD